MLALSMLRLCAPWPLRCHVVSIMKLNVHAGTANKAVGQRKTKTSCWRQRWATKHKNAFDNTFLFIVKSKRLWKKTLFLSPIFNVKDFFPPEVGKPYFCAKTHSITALLWPCEMIAPMTVTAYDSTRPLHINLTETLYMSSWSSSYSITFFQRLTHIGGRSNW